jgi:tetratricopeptide (TPR) repeat protein
MAAVLYSRALLAECRTDFEHARELLLDSLTLLRQLDGQARDVFFRVHTLGLFLAPEGPRGVPRMYYEETLQFFRRADARSAIGFTLAALADVARAQGLTHPARERLLESLAHFREAHDALGTAFTLNRLGNLAGVIGEHDLGNEWLEEALAIRRDLGDRRAVGITIGNLGVLAARAGDLVLGEARIEEALALFEQDDDAPGQMGMHGALGNVAADAGDVDRARVELRAHMQCAERLLLRRAFSWAALRLAELEIAEGDTEQGARLVDKALVRLRELGDRWGVRRALELDQAAAKRSLSTAGEG